MTDDQDKFKLKLEDIGISRKESQALQKGDYAGLDIGRKSFYSYARQASAIILIVALGTFTTDALAQKSSIGKFVAFISHQSEVFRLAHHGHEFFFANFNLRRLYGKTGNIGLVGGFKVISYANQDGLRPIVISFCKPAQKKISWCASVYRSDNWNAGMYDKTALCLVVSLLGYNLVSFDKICAVNRFVERFSSDLNSTRWRTPCVVQGQLQSSIKSSGFYDRLIGEYVNSYPWSISDDQGCLSYISALFGRSISAEQESDLSGRNDRQQSCKYTQDESIESDRIVPRPFPNCRQPLPSGFGYLVLIGSFIGASIGILYVLVLWLFVGMKR